MLFATFAASLFLMQATPVTDVEADKDTDIEETQREEAAPSPPPAETVEADPNIDVVDEKPKKITDRSHPDYVRCKSEAVIGSRARRKRTCLTNREWDLAARRGNEATRDFVGDNQPGFQPGSN